MNMFNKKSKGPGRGRSAGEGARRRPAEGARRSASKVEAGEGEAGEGEGGERGAEASKEAEGAEAPPRGRGRPPGPTERAAETRERLYRAAIARIAAHGYDATTLREIADDAGVSVGLLYRYFPSKRAVVLALHAELSAEYAARAQAAMPRGPWRRRALVALRESLAVLGRERGAMLALTGVLVGDRDEGLFAPATVDARRRVAAVFLEAVRGAADAPPPADADALGRILYVVHLAVILAWLLDRSPGQRATAGLLALLERGAPAAALLLAYPPARGLLRAADELLRDGLLGDPA
ncbi:MAG: helix-turn-helix domain-containing protein [Nannocystaceae bacterium]